MLAKFTQHYSKCNFLDTVISVNYLLINLNQLVSLKS